MANWQCGYLRESHNLVVSLNQQNVGSSGVRLECVNKPMGKRCDYIEAAYAPYAKERIASFLQEVTAVVVGNRVAPLPIESM